MQWTAWLEESRRFGLIGFSGLRFMVRDCCGTKTESTNVVFLRDHRVETLVAESQWRYLAQPSEFRLQRCGAEPP